MKYPRVNERELNAWAALIAAFHVRNGRDPNDAEHHDVLSTARAMAATDGAVLQ